jgi:hypothetical protein
MRQRDRSQQETGGSGDHYRSGRSPSGAFHQIHVSLSALCIHFAFHMVV